MYPECFNGTDKFKNYECHIKLEDNAKSAVHPFRKIALALGGELEKKLQNMVDQGIIDKSNWVNSLLSREKPNGSLCICINPKNLNKTIKREHHPVPTVDDITPRLCGTTLFFKLDAAQSYWNVPLAKESQALTQFKNG